MTASPVFQHLRESRLSTTVARISELRKAISKRLTLALRPAEECCELNLALRKTCSDSSFDFAKLTYSPDNAEFLYVRMPAENLRRVIGMTLEGLRSAAAGINKDSISLNVNIRLCLRGFGAVLEFTGDGLGLSDKLLSALSRRVAVHATDMPGKQLLKAQSLLEDHGGKLSIELPGHGENTQTTVRLSIALAFRTSSPHTIRVGSTNVLA